MTSYHTCYYEKMSMFLREQALGIGLPNPTQQMEWLHQYCNRLSKSPPSEQPPNITNDVIIINALINKLVEIYLIPGLPLSKAWIKWSFGVCKRYRRWSGYQRWLWFQTVTISGTVVKGNSKFNVLRKHTFANPPVKSAKDTSARWLIIWKSREARPVLV